MIRYLRGKVYVKVRSYLIIDVQGVGYNIFVTPPTLTNAPVGEQVEMHISESIREDAHDLYGFLTSSERDMFESLRKVSGVGPKVALGVLSFYSPADIDSIIQSGDVEKLSFVPGIGKKVASKIVVELKDKSLLTTEIEAQPTSDETVTALQSLGYNRQEITNILPKIPDSLKDTSERVTWVLRHLGE